MQNLFNIHQNKIELETELKKKEFVNDWDLSIRTLSQSFITWNRLQKNHIVGVMTLKDVRHRSDWLQRYPNRFLLLHKGSRCDDSIIIGHGKYSKVYKRSNCAYKFIKFFNKRDSQEIISVLKCNLKELLFFHSMNHPNVMRPLRSQIVMEHGRIRRLVHELPLAKCTLLSMILSNEISSFDDIVSIMFGVAKGLQYMHQNNIVHGDVKPSNILIMSDYTPIVSDFTLTTFEGKGNEIAFGTLFWRSPECLIQKDCTIKSDVWSFGVMLLDCLYGSIYFRDVLTSNDSKQLLNNVIHVIGQPPLEWVSKFMGNNEESTQLLFQKNPHIYEKMKLSPLGVLGKEQDKVQFLDLISNIVKWNPEDRFSMTEVLSHPFFDRNKLNTSALWTNNSSEGPDANSSVVNNESLLSKMIAQTLSTQRSKVTCSIIWRNDFEKQHFRDTIIKWHNTTFRKKNIIEKWLVDDIVIMCKRVIERLRSNGSTFNTDNIIYECAAFCSYIWEDRWSHDDDFESSLYHIIHTLDMTGFPLQVTEEMLGERSTKAVGERSAKAVEETKMKQYKFKF